MVKNEALHKRVKYLYYEQDMTEKEVAEILGKSRQWVNAILNSDKNHKELMKKKRRKRTIERNVEFYKDNKTKIAIPIDMFEAIGINDKDRKAIVKVTKNKITIERAKNELNEKNNN